MVIAGMWPKCLPFVTYSTEVRNHKFFAEVRRNRLKTIISFHRLPQSLFVQDDRGGPAGGARKYLTVTDRRTNIIKTADLLIDNVHGLQYRLGQATDRGMPGVFLADAAAMADQHQNRYTRMNTNRCQGICRQ